MANQELEGISHRRSMSKTSLASFESLSMPSIQEIVLSADIRCADCQERVADIMSRMIETYSVLVSVLEKKVTITGIYSGDSEVSTRQISKIYGNTFSKIALIKRLFSRTR